MIEKDAQELEEQIRIIKNMAEKFCDKYAGIKLILTSPYYMQNAVVELLDIDILNEKIEIEFEDKTVEWFSLYRLYDGNLKILKWYSL